MPCSSRRLRGTPRGEDRVDRWVKGSLVDQVAHLGELLAVRFDDEVGGVDALGWLVGDRHQPATLTQQLRGPREHVAAHRVEDQVHRIDASFEDRRAVDDLVRLHAPNHIGAGRRRRGSDDVRGPPRRQLDREVTYPAGRPVHDHTLARLEPAVHEQPLPGGEGWHRHGGSLHVVDCVRLRREDRLRYRRELGGNPIAVERGEREDRIADPHPIDVGRHRGHDAGELVRGCRGQSVCGPVEFVTSDRRGVDADERFARRRIGDVDPLERESLRPLRRSRSDRSHRSLAGLHVLSSIVCSSVCCLPRAATQSGSSGTDWPRSRPRSTAGVMAALPNRSRTLSRVASKV